MKGRLRLRTLLLGISFLTVLHLAQLVRSQCVSHYQLIEMGLVITVITLVSIKLKINETI